MNAIFKGLKAKFEKTGVKSILIHTVSTLRYSSRRRNCC